MPNFCSSIEFAELAGQGFGGFVGDHFQGGGEGVSGADCPGQSVDRLGEKFFDFFKTLLAAVGHRCVGNKCADDQGGPGDGGIAAPDQRGESGDSAADQAEHEKVAGAKLHARLQQSFLNGRNAGGAAQQAIEGGDLAELLVAQQRQFLVRLAFGCFLHGRQTISNEAGLGAALIDQRQTRKGREGHHHEHQERNQQCGHRKRFSNSNC